MIRLLFVLFVTLGGFAAAAVWNLRSDGVAEQIVSPELRTAVAAEVDRLGLPKLAEKLPSPKRTGAAAPVESKPEPQPARAEEPERATPAVVASGTAEPSATEATGGSRDSDESALSGAGGSVAPSDSSDLRVTEVEVLVPRAEFARDFGPVSDHGVETASDAIPVGDPYTTARPDWDDDSLDHDADRSARLIRRMIAVYRSNGSGR
jgi:hypothetical protein